MSRLISFLVFLALTNSLVAQVNFGGWRVHLPYFNNTSITATKDKVYCGSNSGLFSFEVDDGSIERISRINGLSDVEVKIVKHNVSKNITVVAYNNANIDLIDHQTNQIYNVPDVFMKSIIGSKSINQICFFENKVYMACSFGIVVLDIDKKQIVDSYQNLGPNGTQLEFLAINIYNNLIVASALNGIYAVSLDAPNLNDFNFWKLIKPSTKSGLSALYKSKLYILVDSVLKVFDGMTFQDYLPTVGLQIVNIQLSAFEGAGTDLLILTPDFILAENGSGTPSKLMHNFRRDAVYDKRGYICMVDNNYGLTIDNKKTGQLDYVIPNGPVSKTFGKMLYENGKLWVAAGSVNDRWDPLMYNGNKFFHFQDNSWFNFRESDYPMLAGMSDFIDAKKNPYGSEVYLSSFGGGIIEMNGNVMVKKYDESNSTLQRLSVADTTYKPLLSGGMDFDNNGNLWVSNFGVNKPLSVKTNSGWFSFNIGTIAGGNELGWLTCDDYNNKWVLSLKDKGILVYNDNGTPSNVNDDKFKMLTKEVGQGELPSNTVLCVTKDLRGEMWIGTSQGLAILSNPSILFNTDEENFDARQIIIKVGTNYEVFLGKEQINCIKVDAANRKWIGTPNGAWLVSEDGYKVIINFTTVNSPLLSNNVMEIGINEATGEVFFGTEKGIISYMGDASAGIDDFSKVEIFPNPVRPDFTGSVSIRGLIEKSTVKITDISGKLVYETISNGGFASWDGRNFNGKRVSTGVYLIFAASKDGEKSHVGKILFIN
ncbi:MAG: hypothetical protein KA981_06720 [Bacteroidia bacterium]|nr:hypothetical protein [Bacteroidia bacterium]